MVFRDFTFPDVCGKLGLTQRQASLYPDVPPLDPGRDFLTRLAAGAKAA